MIAIVAVEKNWGIGKDGELLVRLPGDLAYFRKTTMGSIVVMGRRTAESLPGGVPLPGRETRVLTRRSGYRFGDAQIVSSVKELLAAVEASDKEAYVCGGGQVYEKLLPYCDTCLVTKIDAEISSDTSFPDLDASEGFAVESEGETTEENGFSYRVVVYTRAGKSV
jgi:dihydrofolate reductase